MNRTKTQRSIRKLTITSMMLALAIALAAMVKYIPFLHMPDGGSISLAMLPLVLISLICGPIWGLSGGIIFGLIDMLLDGAFAWNYMSIILDYFVAFATVVIASIFRKMYFKNNSLSILLGVLLFGILRFGVHFLSGCIVYNTIYTGEGPLTPDFSLPSIIYSLTYNGKYMVPSTALCSLVGVLLAKPLFSLNKMGFFNVLVPEGYEDIRLEKAELNANIVIFTTITLIIFSLIGTIKLPDKLSFYFGIVGLVLSIALLTYSLITAIKYNPEIEISETSFRHKLFKTEKKFYIIASLLIILPIMLSILDILLSMFVYLDFEPVTSLII